MTHDSCIVVGAQGVSAIDPDTMARLTREGDWELERYIFDESTAQVQFLNDDVALVAYKVKEKLTVDGKPVNLDAQRRLGLGSQERRLAVRDAHRVGGRRPFRPRPDEDRATRGRDRRHEGPDTRLQSAECRVPQLICLRALRTLRTRYVQRLRHLLQQVHRVLHAAFHSGVDDHVAHSLVVCASASSRQVRPSFSSSVIVFNAPFAVFRLLARPRRSRCTRGAR